MGVQPWCQNLSKLSIFPLIAKRFVFLSNSPSSQYHTSIPIPIFKQYRKVQHSGMFIILIIASRQMNCYSFHTACYCIFETDHCQKTKQNMPCESIKKSINKYEIKKKRFIKRKRPDSAVFASQDVILTYAKPTVIAHCHNNSILCLFALPIINSFGADIRHAGM